MDGSARHDSHSAVKRIGSALRRLDVLFWVYLVAAVAVSAAEYLKGAKPAYGEGYFHYNNFMIFKYSFYNLLELKDLYIAHPELHFDLYKYSPTFALAMAPIAILPNLLGLTAWNLVNTLPVYFAVRRVLALSEARRAFILWLLLIDVMTSLHNAQSNGLMVALMILAYVCFERKQISLAALCLVATVFIKLFGLVAIFLFLLYPHRLRFIGAAILWTVVLAVLPIVAVPFDYLLELYRSWLSLLLWDHGGHHGLSLFGIIRAWFGLMPPKVVVLAIGSLLLVAPLVRLRQYDRPLFRLLLFSSALIWMVIFNHKAESATFVIAMAGILFWYFGQPRERWRTILLLFAVLLVSVSPTDLFPGWIRANIIAPYELKALPAVVIWFIVQWQLLAKQFLPGVVVPADAHSSSH